AVLGGVHRPAQEVRQGRGEGRARHPARADPLLRLSGSRQLRRGSMRVVVTGAHGKVGRAAVQALTRAGHEVTAVDLTRPVWERTDPAEPAYVQADLTDAGQAFAVVRGAEAVVHAAALPDPTHNPPHVVFRTNLMATFNMVEAAVVLGVRRFVNISSETVPGFFFPERPFLPSYAPIDEDHPI